MKEKIKMINPDLIIQWAHEKGIFAKGTPIAQAGKTKEEAQELHDAVEFNEGLEAIMLEIGDLLVTIIIQAHMQGVTIEQCFWAAYYKIKDRKGEMVNGEFVRERG